MTLLDERAKKIKAAKSRAEHAQRYLMNTVRDAYDAGLTWTEIGALLGVSKQAARQKYAAKIAD
jgi:hypothetical protein